MKSAVADFIVRQYHFQKFREDAVTLQKEQLTVRRRWSDNDIAALFSLGAEVAVKNVVHRVHCLRATTESQNGRISLCRIIAVWKDDFIMNGRIVCRRDFLEHFGLDRLDQQCHGGRQGRSQPHPRRVLWLHLQAPPSSKSPISALLTVHSARMRGQSNARVRSLSSWDRAASLPVGAERSQQSD